MKKITYSIVLLWSVLFCSCQKEDTLTTVPEGGVQLNFSGAQANLSAEELSISSKPFMCLSTTKQEISSDIANTKI